MLQKDKDKKSSKTAMLAAFHRALAHLEFNNEIHGPDHLSHFFLPSFKRFILNFKFIRTAEEYKKLVEQETFTRVKMLDIGEIYQLELGNKTN